MTHVSMVTHNLKCWCGNEELVNFSEEYMRCPVCETLIWSGKQNHDVTTFYDDSDYYGHRYWYEHQVEELGLPDITDRARADLPERCLYWLRTLLKYRLSPGRTLELGSAHGGFVALLQMAGFESTGLELSPDIVEYASTTFQVPMLLGPIETQQIEPASYDLIILMDVLEHLPHPQVTLQTCLELLKPNGLILIQTPEYPASKTYLELEQSTHPFLRMLIPQEHIHLFSKQAVEILFNRMGLPHITFERAYFDPQDMLLIASQHPIQVIDPESILTHMLNNRNSRILLAMIDQQESIERLIEQETVIEVDRSERLKKIEQLEDKIEKIEADRAERLEIIHTLQAQLEQSEADRAERLEIIHTLSAQLEQSEADRAARLDKVRSLDDLIQQLQGDKTARVEAIETLRQQLETIQLEQAADKKVINQLSNQVYEAQKVLDQQQRIMNWFPEPLIRLARRQLNKRK